MRKSKVVVVIISFVVLLLMAGCNKKQSTGTAYDSLKESSPTEIEGEKTTVKEVELIVENVAIVSDDERIERDGTLGIATFTADGKVYMIGHETDQKVGSKVYKVNKSDNRINESDLIGEVIANQEKGVLAEPSSFTKTYSKITVAKTAHLGEATLLGRDDDGNICEYPINIEAFEEEKDMIFYSFPEAYSKEGSAGAPIIQDNKLIGVDFGTTQEEGKGVGWTIWSILP